MLIFAIRGVWVGAILQDFEVAYAIKKCKTDLHTPSFDSCCDNFKSLSMK